MKKIIKFSGLSLVMMFLMLSLRQDAEPQDSTEVRDSTDVKVQKPDNLSVQEWIIDSTVTCLMVEKDLLTYYITGTCSFGPTHCEEVKNFEKKIEKESKKAFSKSEGKEPSERLIVTLKTIVEMRRAFLEKSLIKAGKQEMVAEVNNQIRAAQKEALIEAYFSEEE